MLPNNPLARSGGGGSNDPADDGIDTDESIARGEVINDVRGNVAGYDDDVDTGFAGSDPSDYDITTTDAPTGSDDTDGTVIDPDGSGGGSDVVGVVTSDDAVAVTTQTDDGGTETTGTQRGSGNDPSSTTQAPTANNGPVNDPNNGPALGGMGGDAVDGIGGPAVAIALAVLALLGIAGAS